MQSEVPAPAVQGTLNILQACSANNVQKVIRPPPLFISIQIGLKIDPKTMSAGQT